MKSTEIQPQDCPNCEEMDYEIGERNAEIRRLRAALVRLRSFGAGPEFMDIINDALDGRGDPESW